MQYQVLARKWRPQNFHEIVGQEHVSQTLLNALRSGRVAHAFLFSGPRGSGKTTTARILAKALNCHRGDPSEPCGQCPACIEIAAGNCLDVLEIDAASNRGIDEIRELREKVQYHPARDRYKIFIVDEVHMLTPEAFNALLKTLEEPPPHVVFILATTEYHKIPATILSRCQQYSFKLIKYPLILQRLQQIAQAEGIEISREALEQVVFSSGGSMRDAMSALDQVIAFSGTKVRDEDVATLLGLVEPMVLRRTIRSIASCDLAAIFEIVGELVEAGQDLNNFVRRFSGHLRNLMVLKAGVSDPALLGIPESLLPDLREQAELFSREDLLRLFDAVQKIETAMKYASQVRFQLEMGLVELAHLARLRPLEKLIAELSSQHESGQMRERDTGLVIRDSAQTSGKQKDLSISLPDAESMVPPPTRSRPPEGEPKAKGAQEAILPGMGHNSVKDKNARELLAQIAAAVGRVSLESLLLTLERAKLEGDEVRLECRTTNEFTRRQIQDNLALITQAASKIVGSPVKVTLKETGVGESDPISNKPNEYARSSEEELLEKVKREPIVSSFFNLFPGPVKIERLDS